MTDAWAVRPATLARIGARAAGEWLRVLGLVGVSFAVARRRVARAAAVPALVEDGFAASADAAASGGDLPGTAGLARELAEVARIRSVARRVLTEAAPVGRAAGLATRRAAAGARAAGAFRDGLGAAAMPEPGGFGQTVPASAIAETGVAVRRPIASLARVLAAMRPGGVAPLSPAVVGRIDATSLSPGRVWSRTAIWSGPMVSPGTMPGIGAVAGSIRSVAPVEPTGSERRDDAPASARRPVDDVVFSDWIDERLTRAVGRPPSGVTGFDPRVSPMWPGAPSGY